MEDAQDAITKGNSRQLVEAVRTFIPSQDDLKSLIDTALNFSDYDAIWYLLEIASRENITNLSKYVMNKCGTVGERFPCQVVSRLNDPFGVLQEAVNNANTDLVLYSIDILYSSLDPTFFVGYDTNDYMETEEIAKEIDRRVEAILMGATPAYFSSLFGLLPNRLRTNLILASSTR